jgi:hypothetical protein
MKNSVFVFVFVALLLGPCSKTNETTQMTGAEVKTNVVDCLGKMFQDDGTNIWYQKAGTDDYADKSPTKTRFHLDKEELRGYEHLFDCTWEQAESSDADVTTAASVSIGEDEKHCFRFLLGNNIVICIDGENRTYYRAYNEKAESSFDFPMAPLSHEIMFEFSGYELSASNLPLKDHNFASKEEIAYAFLEQKIAYLKAMTPENWYALTDYQIRDLKVEEENDNKFVFLLDSAIKPKVLENSPWMAGNGGYGEGKWAGYIVRSGQYRLDLIDGYWKCVAADGGDVTLKDNLVPNPMLE